MISSEIKIFNFNNNERCKVQIVELDSFDSFEFGQTNYDEKSFDRIYHLYNDFVVPRFPDAFETMILFRLPSDLKIEIDKTISCYGTLFKPSSIAKNTLENGLKVSNKQIIFKTKQAEDLYKYLYENDCIRLVFGKKPGLVALPINNNFGLLSKVDTNYSFKVNSSFFTMDRFDIDSIYDSIGTPIGLQVKDGKILNPPLFNRETLLVNKNNEIEIKSIGIDDLMIFINDKLLTDYYIYARPTKRKTPSGGFDIVVINNEIVATKIGGKTIIPSSGYVIKLKEEINIENRIVKYAGLENYKFGLQVGNSVIKDGKTTESFISSFYNIYKPFTVSYPPSLYPLDYKKARAPRIVLGERNSKPIILWFEGMGKFGFDPDTDSYGASLKEVCDICKKLGINNAINLDGGGSAQILLNNKRELLISDRDQNSYLEMERAIPVFLKVR